MFWLSNKKNNFQKTTLTGGLVMFLCCPQITFLLFHKEIHINSILLEICGIEEFKSSHLILLRMHSSSNKNKIAVEYNLIACLYRFKRHSYT